MFSCQLRRAGPSTVWLGNHLSYPIPLCLPRIAILNPDFLCTFRFPPSSPVLITILIRRTTTSTMAPYVTRRTHIERSPLLRRHPKVEPLHLCVWPQCYSVARSFSQAWPAPLLTPSTSESSWPYSLCASQDRLPVFLLSSVAWPWGLFGWIVHRVQPSSPSLLWTPLFVSATTDIGPCLAQHCLPRSPPCLER